MTDQVSKLKQPRLVLCPHGIPPHRRQICTSILVHCGGDVSRLLDAPVGEAPFLEHLKRLVGMLNALRPPIVMLTDLSPLMERVVQLRQRYERELPQLRQADWVLYLHCSQHVFVSEALRHGHLERLASTGVWHGPQLTRYLVVSPESDVPCEIEAGMQALRAPLEIAAGTESTGRMRVARPVSLLDLRERQKP